jgi:class 3 adenylate cyclase
MASVKRTGHPCAILFVDLFGSSELYRALGNARAHAAIAKTLALLTQAIARHCGDVVKTIGDGAMCVFSSARHAMDAAMDMQGCIKQAAVVSEFAGTLPALRVGFHYGPVILQGTDVFGDAVNVAARVLAQAKPGEILLTKETAKTLPKRTANTIRSVGSTIVKGKADPVELCQVIFARDGLTVPRNPTHAPASRLVVRFGNKVDKVGPRKPLLRMGRSPDNEFVVTDPSASRVHARIEYRSGMFVLVDESLNGTYLSIGSKAEIVLRRDEMALESSGLICLGRSVVGAQHPCLKFKVQNVGQRADASRVP